MMYDLRTLKILIVGILTLCSISSTTYAQPCAVEGKTGAFIPFSRKMSRIFNPTMPFIEVEGSYRFCRCWDAWAGVGCIFGDGHSISCDTRTSIRVFPFTFGVRRVFPLCCNVDAFIGVGGLWSLYNNHDHSSSVKKHIWSNTFGATLKGSLQYHLRDRVALTSFAEYVYQRFSFHKIYKKHLTYRHDVDMSGIKLGLGVLYDF